MPCQPQDTPSLLLCWSVLATLPWPVTPFFQPLLCPQEPSLPPPTPLERRVYITDRPSVLRLNWSCLGDLETVNAASKSLRGGSDPGSARGEDSQETSLPSEVDSCLPHTIFYRWRNSPVGEGTHSQLGQLLHGKMLKTAGFGVRQTWGQTQFPPLRSCVALITLGLCFVMESVSVKLKGVSLCLAQGLVYRRCWIPEKKNRCSQSDPDGPGGQRLSWGILAPDVCQGMCMPVGVFCSPIFAESSRSCVHVYRGHRAR